MEGGDPGPGGRQGGSGGVWCFTSENGCDLTLLSDLPHLLTRKDNYLFFRVSVLSPARIGKNGPSGPVMSPVSLFPVFSDRPVSGVFAGSLTENPAIGPVCLSGDFAREKTGLFRACFNQGSGGEMRFGLWRGVIRDPAVAKGGLAGFGVLRRRMGAI